VSEWYVHLLNTITGKRIAVLGFAFKKNTGGHSGITAALKTFPGENAKVSIYNPRASEKQYGAALPPAPQPGQQLVRAQQRVTIHKTARKPASKPKAMSSQPIGTSSRKGLDCIK